MGTWPTWAPSVKCKICMKLSSERAGYLGNPTRKRVLGMQKKNGPKKSLPSMKKFHTCSHHPCKIDILIDNQIISPRTHWSTTGFSKLGGLNCQFSSFRGDPRIYKVWPSTFQHMNLGELYNISLTWIVRPFEMIPLTNHSSSEVTVRSL